MRKARVWMFLPRKKRVNRILKRMILRILPKDVILMNVDGQMKEMHCYKPLLFGEYLCVQERPARPEVKKLRERKLSLANEYLEYLGLKGI